MPSRPTRDPLAVHLETTLRQIRNTFGSLSDIFGTFDPLSKPVCTLPPKSGPIYLNFPGQTLNQPHVRHNSDSFRKLTWKEKVNRYISDYCAKYEGAFNIFPEAKIVHDIFHLTELDQDHLSELLMEKEAGIFHQKESRLNLSAGKNGDKKGSRIGLNRSQNSFLDVRKQN